MIKDADHPSDSFHDKRERERERKRASYCDYQQVRLPTGVSSQVVESKKKENDNKQILHSYYESYYENKKQLVFMQTLHGVCIYIYIYTHTQIKKELQRKDLII